MGNGVQTTITGYFNQTSLFNPVQVIGGRPRSVSNTYEQEIAVGNVPNHTAVTLFASVASVNNLVTDFNNLGVGVTTVPVPVAPIAFEIVSTSALDTAAGSGANTVEINGLDANWDIVSEVMTLNGASAVTTTNTYRRVNDIHVMSLGASGVTVGIISVSNSAGGTKYSSIIAGQNQCLQAHYTVPRNFQAVITDFAAGGLGGNTTTDGVVKLWTTADPSDSSVNTDVFYIKDAVEYHESAMSRQFRLVRRVPPQAIIKATIEKNGSSGLTGYVSIDFFLDPA